jgi:integrase
MRYAARHGAVTVNPVPEVGRIDSTPVRRPRALTAQERKPWLDAVESNKQAREWDLPDLTRMLATDCRIGECLAIGWTEVDLDAEEVDIAWHLVRATGVGLLRVPSTKSGEKGERLVPLPGWAVTMLKRRREAIGGDVDRALRRPDLPLSARHYRARSSSDSVRCVVRMPRSARGTQGVGGWVSGWIGRVGGRCGLPVPCYAVHAASPGRLREPQHARNYRPTFRDRHPRAE